MLLDYNLEQSEIPGAQVLPRSRSGVLNTNEGVNDGMHMTENRLHERKRARTGCLTCRRRHYKCDEIRPHCTRCRKSNRDCTWPEHYIEPSKKKNNAKVVPIAEAAPDSPAITQTISTRDTDTIAYYVNRFHNYSFQICAWTSLLELPRRSFVPSILQLSRNGDKKMTNWANFFLPHLSTGSADDPLSLSISAFTALRLQHPQVAATFYSLTLQLLRKILLNKEAASMGNQEFLRIWATTVLLAEYEAHMGNQEVQARHVKGATTLSFIAARRFALRTPDGVTPPAIAENKDNVPRNERELPAYLAQFTQRLHHSTAINASLDREWPMFQTPIIERNALGGLLEKSAECYAHVMPLVEEFYSVLAVWPPTTPAAYQELIDSFKPRVIMARQAIEEYRYMLDQIPLHENEIFKSCAEDSTFPFSPIIKFANPLMAQPTVIPYIFLMFLAPFISAAEHKSCIRYISGVFAGFSEVDGLRLNSAFPDIYVASFWRKGPERAYFFDETQRRAGDFMEVLNRIWGTIDHLQVSRNGLELGRVEILGIALKEYRAGMARGLKLQHTRH